MKTGEILPEIANNSFFQNLEGVPDYSLTEYKARQSKYIVCVFVLNEGNRVATQLKEMKKFCGFLDIVVADGGSTDGSLEDVFLKSVEVTALLTKLGPGGLSAQMRMAFHFAHNQGYEGVITIDGNGKDGIDAIPHFITLLDEGYDHIQGSRFIPGGEHLNTPKSRLFAIKFIHAPLISWASGVVQTDTTNGFRAYSSKLLTDREIRIFRDVFKTYELHYYLAIETSRRNDFLMTETPVSRRYPSGGKIPTKISPIKGNIKVLYILIQAILGRYRPR